MSLTRRERRAGWPLEMVASEDWFDRAFRDLFLDFMGPEAFLDRSEARSHLMRVEEYVEGDTCVIRAELPGIDPSKDVELSVSDGILHLKAHREERSEEERPGGYRSEFRYGSLERHIRLPEGSSEEDVKATYTDGILEVRVPAPKAEETKPVKKIPVARS